jgi:hypothetical protein
MPLKLLDPKTVDDDPDADWEGNNAAFKCPSPNCGSVFIVSEQLHRGPNGETGWRKCKCQLSVARISGGRKSGGTASIEW